MAPWHPLLLALPLLISIGASHTRAEDFQGSTHSLPFDEAPILYSEGTPTDPIAHLQEGIATGEVKLEWDDEHGYLPGLLKALEVPESSQVLVFSKTSMQRKLISPENPRALYFNDDVYLGFIPGAPKLEIASVDSKLGSIFYTLEQEKVRKPKFVRDADCLRCHGSARSLGVPGPILRSIATDEKGELETGRETEQVNHCTPIAERWAGWYVTGKHGEQKHLGNLIGSGAYTRHESEPNFAGNVTDLSAYFKTAAHLRPTSDIAALMVLEHQSHMHNYITRLRFETEIMTGMYGHVRYLKNQINAFLRYLLFVEEVPLIAPIEGDPAFLADFAKPALRDHKGRSLRDLDLQTRMFKYPCSYLIYSPAFDELPAAIREMILERLWNVLTGKDADPQFARLSTEDRQAILEILRETKPNLPAYWKAS